MTAKKEMTLVYYYVPEDKDDPDFPNVFGIMMPKANIRYQHIEEQFPLRGQYIFRFKVMHDNNVVWLDLQDPQSRLPTFKERVFVKATRISWDPSEHVKNPYKFEAEKTKVTAPPEVQPKQASNIELLSDPPAPQPKQSTFMNIDNDLLI